MKWVVIMKNTSSISTTSTREMMLSSGSSHRCRSRSFTATPALLPFGRRLSPLQCVHQAHGLPLHLHYHVLHPAAQVAVSDVGWDGNREACDRRDERLGDAACERR